MTAISAETLCEVRVEHKGWADCEPAELAERCAQAVRAAFPDTPFPASILFTDNAEMQALNARYRDRDKPTNVLSFPAGKGVAPDQPFLGDIALGFEICRDEAARHGVSLSAHAAHLLIHGMLHLIGYDHETDEDAVLMQTEERAILVTMGIADPYEKAGER